MSKNDTQFSRAAVLADEEDLEDLLRPQTPVKPRSPRPPREEAPRRERAPLSFSLNAPTAEAEDEDLPLRARRRLPVRRNFFPATRAGRIVFAAGVVAALAAMWLIFVATRYFFEHDPRFRIDSAASIQIVGNSQLTRQELLGVFGGDIGRNIFYVPLAARRTELESLPWVEHATVMRLLPDQLRVAVTERVPVAFVRKGNRIELIDRNGVLLTMPPAVLAAKHYSFPVISGVTPGQDPELRADRMRLYQKFLGALDETGANVSQTLSEVDLSDPEDVRAVLPVSGSDILVHFGDGEFANRYRTFQSHLPEWQRQYPHLAAVDLRFEHQTVLEMAKGANDENTANSGQETLNAKAPSQLTSPAPVIHKSSPTPKPAHPATSRHPSAFHHLSHPATPRHAVPHSPAKTAGKGTRLPAARG